MTTKTEIKSHPPVLASREMTARETENWLDYYNLSLSVSFSDGVYTADLRTPAGDGSSVSTMQGKAAGYDVALIAACQNYEKARVARVGAP